MERERIRTPNSSRGLISVNSIAKWILSTAVARMPGAPIAKVALPTMGHAMNEYTTLWSEAVKSERRKIKMNEDFCDAMNAAIAAGLERRADNRTDTARRTAFRANAC